MFHANVSAHRPLVMPLTQKVKSAAAPRPAALPATRPPVAALPGVPFATRARDVAIGVAVGCAAGLGAVGVAMLLGGAAMPAGAAAAAATACAFIGGLVGSAIRTP